MTSSPTATADAGGRIADLQCLGYLEHPHAEIAAVCDLDADRARARAEATVKQLQSLISDLDKQAAKAESQGNARKANEAREAIAARRDKVV